MVVNHVMSVEKGCRIVWREKLGTAFVWFHTTLLNLMTQTRLPALSPIVPNFQIMDLIIFQSGKFFIFCQDLAQKNENDKQFKSS